MTNKWIEIKLDDFSDEEIKEEHDMRNLSGTGDNLDEHVELERCYRLHHQGKKDEAYEILWRMCLIKLNKVV